MATAYISRWLTTSKKADAEPVDETVQAAQLKELLGGAVDDALKAGGEEGLTEHTLRRWLVARKRDVDAAHRDLKSHSEWRVKNVPDGRMKEETVRNLLDRHAVSLQGLDDKGRPLLYISCCKHIPAKGTQELEQVRHFLIYCLDAAVALADRTTNPRGRLLCILDLNKFSMSNWDLGAAQVMAEALQNHYPERVDRIVLYDAPYFFAALWKLVYAFLDPVTREKVQFVTAAEAATVMPQLFSRELLPPALGGSQEFVSVDVTVQKKGLVRGQLPAVQPSVQPQQHAADKEQQEGVLPGGTPA